MNRSAGILMSVTSLPSKYGIGCFSKEAYEFVDWLAEAGQTYWQILPLGPTSYGGADDSPYQAFSAFAGNPYMICLEDLIEEGVLTQAECDALDFGSGNVDYDKLHEHRWGLLRKAYERSNISQVPEYQEFLKENNWWLSDYALYMALKSRFKDAGWTTWPEDIRLRYWYALDYYRRELYFDIEYQQYMQFKFFQQWLKLKDYANKKHIQIVGDIPIYVSPDSSDVWAHPELFQLDENNTPTAVAGCPPDAFSADGQMWGNPLYRWDYHRQTGYEWWISRLYQSFRLYDAVRIDHFRGFDEYFSIPYGSKTALTGHWEPGPGMDLFKAVKRKLGDKQFIAEDLGHMTDTVRQLVKDSGFPNMKVLQFGFDANDIGASNDYLPHNCVPNSVVYTGTHDNETLVGWLEGMSDELKTYFRNYVLDHHTTDAELYHTALAVTMATCSRICIVPIQDWLGLDNTGRMNQPSTVKKNWRWRMAAGSLTKEVQDEVILLTRRYGRFNWATIQKEEPEEEVETEIEAEAEE